MGISLNLYNKKGILRGDTLKNLIVKEFKLFKIMVLFSMILGLIFAYLGVTQTEAYIVSQIIYTYIIIFLVYLGLMFMSYKESRVKSDIIFNSLPVKRSDIVKSKYISFLLYLLLVVGVVYIGSNVFSIINGTLGKAIRIIDVLLVAGLCLLFISIYLPFEFYNIGKLRVFNTIFYFLIILLPNIIKKYGNKIVSSSIFKMIIKLDFNSVAIILLGFSIVFFLISLYVSIAIYERKEF